MHELAIINNNNHKEKRKKKNNQNTACINNLSHQLPFYQRANSKVRTRP